MAKELNITAIRVRERMDETGWTQESLAEAIGATQGAISQIITGASRKSRLLPQIADRLAVNLNWLLGVTDEKIDMFDATGEQVTEDMLAAMKAGIIENVLQQPDQLKTMKPKTKLRPSASVIAEDLGLVALREMDLAIGMGAAYLDQPIAEVQRLFPREWLDLYTRTPAEKLIIAKGAGDSMVPTIQNNDLVLIDTTQNVPRMADEVYAVSYCGLGCVKRLRPTRDGGWLLTSDNPNITPITAYDGELHVLGKVVAYFRKM